MRRGVTTFLPRIAQGGGRLGAPVVTPLFPGYLFLNIELERQFFNVVWTPGVKRFVGFGAAPTAVEPEVIGFLVERGGAEGVIRIARSLGKGDLVRVRRGPLEGLVGIVENPVSARGRVRVLMELLRRQTRVELPEHLIERLPA